MATISTGKEHIERLYEKLDSYCEIFNSGFPSLRTRVSIEVSITENGLPVNNEKLARIKAIIYDAEGTLWSEWFSLPTNFIEADVRLKCSAIADKFILDAVGNYLTALVNQGAFKRSIINAVNITRLQE